MTSNSDGSGVASNSPSLNVAEGSGDSAAPETSRAPNSSAARLNDSGLSGSTGQPAPIVAANGSEIDGSRQQGGRSEPHAGRSPTRPATLEAFTNNNQTSHYEAADIATWSLPLPMPKTIGSTTAWLDLPQFQLHDATRPFHRDRAVDAVMSRLDERVARIDLEQVQSKVEDFAFAAVTSAYDETWVLRHMGKMPLQRATSRSTAVENRADLETALEELIDEPLFKPRGVRRV